MAGRVDQVLAGFAEGDAISHEADHLRRLLRDSGVESEIFVEPRFVSPLMADRCRPLAECCAGPDDVLVYHYSTGSPAAHVFLAAPARKVLLYHNITPARFFEGFDDRQVRQLRAAREELAGFLPRVDAAWADSAFNAAELTALGARNARVFQLPFSPERLDQPPDPNVFDKFEVPMTNVLYVGRIAPNKRIERLIHAFAWYHRVLNRQSRLLIVGSERTAPRYFLMLRMLASEIEVPTVCFECFASAAGLPAYYELADVFVTASEHEGYCLPLVEAMHKGVPVIAPQCGGMPEALGGAGVLYEDLGPCELAQLIHRVVTEGPLREEILASQRRRMAEIAARDVAAELKELLAELR